MRRQIGQSWLSLHPTQVVALGFLGVILLGTLALMLPVATVDNQGLHWLDALFTATSAVCVTGLVVVDTGSMLTRFGQIIILVLVQIGGLGFMSLAAMIAVLLGKRITINNRVVLKESLNHLSLQGIVQLVRYIVFLTLGVELIGALVLAWSFGQHMPFGDALFHGVFHAVSAFNNAGFDLFTTSLITYNTNPVVMTCVMLLLTIGGMGVLVWLNIINHGWQVTKWSLHTKIVMLTSALLLVIGSLLVFVFEYHALAFADFTLGEKILNSIFQSATSRTAGFFSVNMTSLTTATIMLMPLYGPGGGTEGNGAPSGTFRFGAKLYDRAGRVSAADPSAAEEVDVVINTSPRAAQSLTAKTLVAGVMTLGFWPSIDLR